MDSNRTFLSVDSLSYLEAKRFRDFLASPYFNKETELSHLFELIRYREGSPAWETDRHIAISDAPTLHSRKNIHQLLFPTLPYDDQNIRRMLSVLQKLILQFFACEQIQSPSIHRSLMILPAIRKKNLHTLYEYEFQKAEHMGSETAVHDSMELLNNHLLATEYQQYIEVQKDRSATRAIIPAIQTLDHFYFAHKLRHLCAALNHNAILQTDVPTGLESELIAYLLREGIPEIPAIEVYFAIYEMLKNPAEEAHYQKVRAALSQHALQFTPAEGREMYAYPQNFCIQRINQGRNEYLSELFQLYRELLEQEIILEKGQLSPWDFKNIVTVALRMNAHNWAEEFILQYAPKIEVRFRENAKKYNLARLAYARGLYSGVLRQLNEVDYEDIFYALDSRVLLLKTYFELDETEPLYSLMDSFRVYLHRNHSISDSHRATYLNLIRFTKKLTKIRPSEKAKLRKLHTEILQATHIADARWLTEKIEKSL